MEVTSGRTNERDIVPIIRDGELDIISHSPEQTGRLGTRLGKLLRPGDVVCLSGDMGAGKTVFARGIGLGWGAAHPLTSPTFSIMHQHKRPADGATLYHLDSYRLQDADELDSIGFDDFLDGAAVVLIEWPERILTALPDDHLWLSLRVIEDTRRNLIVEGRGARAQELVGQFKGKTFGV